MTERPILFSGPMVRAILEPLKHRRKTQTRREIKHFDGTTYARDPANVRWQFTDRDPWPAEWPKAWRYRWCAYDRNDGSSALPVYSLLCPYGISGDRLWVRETFGVDDWNRYVYRADNSVPDSRGWRPSIFMKRAASRITLSVERVRVERLHEISYGDATEEGWTEDCLPLTPTEWYRLIWESINGMGSWYRNPWVFVIDFRRMR